MNKASLKLSFALPLFCLFFLSYAYFYNGSGWNQDARMAQIYSVVEEGRLSINAFSEVTKDVAVCGDHLYPNKPPGSTILGVLPYALCYGIEKMLGADPIKNPFWILWSAYFVNLFANALFSALGAVFFFRIGLLVSKNAPDALLLSLAYGLGTMVLPYSTFYLGHAQALSFYTLGFFYFYRALFSEEGKSWDFFLAGLGMGAAVLVDFFMVYLAFFCWLYFFWARASVSQHRNFLAGAIGPAMILFAYQWIAFANPFSTPMSHNLPMFQYNRTDLFLGAFQIPPSAVMKELLTGDHYGLFTFNPILIFGVAGLGILIVRKTEAPLGILIALQCALTFLSGSAFIGWWGGQTAGPRYLMGCIPPLLFASAFALQFRAVRLLFCGILLWSFYLNLAVTATTPQPGQMKSLKDDILPAFQSQAYAANKQFPRLLNESLPPEWREQASFNLGQKMGLPPMQCLGPLLGIQFFLLCFLIYQVRKKPAAS